MNRTLLVVTVTGILFTASSCNLYHALGGRWKQRKVTTPAVDTARKDTTAITADTAILKRDTGTRAEAPSIDSAKAALLVLWRPLWERPLQFSTFSGKAKAHYESSSDNEDFTANIRIEKDRKIWISVTALGLFEAARVLITPDTIIAIDRIHKEVRIVPFADADKLLPTGIAASFGALQSLILGSVLSTGARLVSVADSGETIRMKANGPEVVQTAGFSRRDSTLLQQFVTSKDASLNEDYADYQIADGHQFSNTRNLQIQLRAELSRLRLEFVKVSFDHAVEMSFSVPEKYERK